MPGLAPCSPARAAARLRIRPSTSRAKSTLIRTPLPHDVSATQSARTARRKISLMAAQQAAAALHSTAATWSTAEQGTRECALLTAAAAADAVATSVGDSERAGMASGHSAEIQAEIQDAHAFYEAEVETKLRAESPGGHIAAGEVAAEAVVDVEVAGSDEAEPGADVLSSREVFDLYASEQNEQTALIARAKALSAAASTVTAAKQAWGSFTVEQAFPEFAQHWDQDAVDASKEGGRAVHGGKQLTPQLEVATLFNLRLPWRCPVADDHVWITSLQQRQKNAECPCCANKKVSVTNSLATLRPELAAQVRAFPIYQAPACSTDLLTIFDCCAVAP